jgi:hypothetical protein
MDSTEIKIRDAIETHLALAAAYKRMMTEIENKRFVFRFVKQATKPNAIDILEKAFEVIIIMTPFLLFISAALSGFKPGKRYIFKPCVKYLLDEHVRRQYQKLYRFYLAELVVQRKNCPKQELEELREIASDIRDYSETLPSLKRVIAALLGALSISGTSFGIYGVDISYNLPKVPAETIAILAFIIGSIILITVLVLFLPAFLFKRSLFIGNNSPEGVDGSIHFDKAKTTKLYNSSTYKLEDQLFELLGAKDQKPKEIPIDSILRISYGIFFMVPFLIIIIISVIGSRLPRFEEIGFILLFVVPIAMIYVILPIIRYRNRVKARLV